MALLWGHLVGLSGYAALVTEGAVIGRSVVTLEVDATGAVKLKTLAHNRPQLSTERSQTVGTSCSHPCRSLGSSPSILGHRSRERLSYDATVAEPNYATAHVRCSSFAEPLEHQQAVL